MGNTLIFILFLYDGIQWNPTYGEFRPKNSYFEPLKLSTKKNTTKFAEICETTLVSQKITKFNFETTLVSQKKTFFENTGGIRRLRSEICTSSSQRRRTFWEQRRVNFCLRSQKHVVMVEKKWNDSQNIVLNTFFVVNLSKNNFFVVFQKHPSTESKFSFL